MMLAGAEIVDKTSVAYRSENTQNVVLPAAGTSEVIPAITQGLSRVPTREPVDIHFSNVTCTVKLGINKGKLTYCEIMLIVSSYRVVFITAHNTIFI